MLDVSRLLPKPITIRTDEEAEKLLLDLEELEVVAYDTETTGLSRISDIALFLALSDGVRRWCVGPEQIGKFKHALMRPDLKLVAHNSNYDAWMMHNIGIPLHHTRNRRFDTAVMHLLYDDDAPHDLEFIAQDLLGIRKLSFSKMFKLKKGDKVGEVLMKYWDSGDWEKVSHYASLDAYATMLIFDRLRDLLMEEDIDEENTLWDYYLNYELPYGDVLFQLELNGIEVDMDNLLELIPQFETREHELAKWFAREAGELCKTTGKTVHRLFFETLQKEPLGYTDTNQPQLNKDCLGRWAAQGCEHSAKLLEWRQTKDFLGKYLRNIVGFAKLGNGRVHPTYNQHIVRSGRLSSADPNMQNQHPEIKHAYVPGKGKVFMCSDYAQMEWRVAAHLSGDPKMIADILDGRDAHASTAAAVFNVPYDDIIAAKKRGEEGTATEEDMALLKLRSNAKTLNFGVLFGEGAQGVAHSLGISLEEAQQMLYTFRDTYKVLHKYFWRIIGEAEETGVCWTMLGRPRRLRHIGSGRRSKAAEDERKAKNSPIQGSASDLMKVVMMQLHDLDEFQEGRAKMVAQVHDEILLQLDEELRHDESFVNTVLTIMRNPLGPDTLCVPLPVDTGWGTTWKEAKGA